MNSFGLKDKDEKYGEYIGKWVVISPYNTHDRHSGKLVGFKGGEAVLNPFYGPIEVDVQEGVKYGIIEGNETASIDVPLSIREISEEYLRNLATFVNLQSKLDLEARLKSIKGAN